MRSSQFGPHLHVRRRCERRRFSDADGLCDGAMLSLMKRVAPNKRLRVVAATSCKLERDVYMAWGGVAGESEDSEDANRGRASFFERLFAAVKAALQDVSKRVYVQYSSKADMAKVKKMLEERQLWSDERCKMYTGGMAPSDKADLQATQEETHMNSDDHTPFLK